MNKQVAIAGLVAAAAAQIVHPCPEKSDNGPIVARAKKQVTDITALQTAATAATAALVAKQTAEQTLYDTAVGRVTAQAAILLPFTNALATATTNHQTQADEVVRATAAIAALVTPISTATAALTAANAAVTAQNLLITPAAALVTQYGVEETEHTAELATMNAALATATTAETTAIASITTATASANALIATRDTALTGQAALDTAADSAKALKDTALTTATTNLDNYQANSVTYETTLNIAQKKALLTGAQLAACSGTDNCNNSGAATFANDPIFTLWNTGNTANDLLQVAMYGANKDPAACQAGSYCTAWATLVTAKATAQDEAKQAEAAVTVSNGNLTTINASITTLQNSYAVAATGPPVVNAGSLTIIKDAATTTKTVATTNRDTVATQLAQSTTSKAHAQSLLDTLNTALTPLSDDVVVKTYLLGLQTAQNTVEEAAKAAAQANLADLLALKTQAQITVDRATTNLAFYQAVVDNNTAKAAADAAVATNAALILSLGVDLAEAEALVIHETNVCKGLGYDSAQSNKKAALDDAAEDAAEALAIAAAYNAASAFSTSGGTNTLCAKPKADADRPPCSEGFCCGAAQKFLKDGTKLAIETCQKEAGVHTYTYYPPLPAGATKAPTAETWRFQCISGAQKLAAAATAVLAASYMMA